MSESKPELRGRFLIDGEVDVWSEADPNDLRLRREAGEQRVRLMMGLAEISGPIEGTWRVSCDFGSRDSGITTITYRAHNVLRNVTVEEAAMNAGELDAFLQEVWIQFDQDLFGGGGMKGSTVTPDNATKKKFEAADPADDPPMVEKKLRRHVSDQVASCAGCPFCWSDIERGHDEFTPDRASWECQRDSTVKGTGSPPNYIPVGCPLDDLPVLVRLADTHAREGVGDGAWKGWTTGDEDPDFDFDSEEDSEDDGTEDSEAPRNELILPVSGCVNCHFHASMPQVNVCGVEKRLLSYLEMANTAHWSPDWCPLRSSPITIKLKTSG